MELRPVAFLLVESVAYPSARLTAFIGASAAPVGEAAVVAGDVLASVPEGPSSGAPSPLGSGVIDGLSSPSPSDDWDTATVGLAGTEVNPAGSSASNAKITRCRYRTIWPDQ